MPELGGFGTPALPIGADGSALGGAGLLFNETTFDRERGNTNQTVLPSAARAGTTGSPIVTNYNGRGVILALNVTVAPGGAETLQLVVLGFFGALTPTLVQSTAWALVAGATGVLVVYPGALNADMSGGAAAFREARAIPIPRFYQVLIVPSVPASSWTYSLSALAVL